MKRAHTVLTFAVLLMAAMMAVNEFPELLTLTDNTSNDYVTVRTGGENAHHVFLKRTAGQQTTGRVELSSPARLHVALDPNFVVSPTAKSPRGLLMLLVTQRT